MNKTVELACAHSILVFTFFLALGWFVVAGWMPLVEPAMDAVAVAEMFERDRLSIQLGLTMLGFAGALWWTFAAAIASQMQRIEGEHHPLTRIQMTCSSGTAMIILITAWLGLAITFRSDINPTTVQLANDFIWLCFVGFYPPGVLQNIAIGACILSDKREKPIYPRWVAFANFWFALAFMPGIYIVFFKEGPFAWSGLLGFWIIALGFFAWIGVMWRTTVNAIKAAD